MSNENRLDINWFNAVGGAMAAVSAAVVLSTLGTAGTLIGAALGSLCITVGSAVYAHSMRVASERLLAKRAALARLSVSRASEGPGATQRLQPPPDLAEPPPKESRMAVLRGLPWKRIAVVSAALFAVAMAVILAFELGTGRPVSYYTGGTGDSTGTSVPGVGGRGDDTETPTEGPDGPAETPTQQDEDPAEEEQDPVLPPEEEPTPLEETVAPSPTESPEQPETSAAE